MKARTKEQMRQMRLDWAVDRLRAGEVVRCAERAADELLAAAAAAGMRITTRRPRDRGPGFEMLRRAR